MGDSLKDDQEQWKWSEQKFAWVREGETEEEEAAGNTTVLNMYALRSSGVQNLTEIRETSDHVGIYNIPLYGRIHLVKHKPGWIHVSIIILYWLYGNWSAFTYILFPYVEEGIISPVFTYVHSFFSLMTIVSLFRASTLNPGRMPIKGQKDRPPKPNSPKGEMDYCQSCLQSRPWKSHHCRLCGQCVRKMDHHCPWINNCVGEDNHFAFMLLTVYAMLMSAWVFLMLVLEYYYWPGLQHIPTTWAWEHKKGFKIAMCILSALMGGLMATLSMTQHVGVVLGMSTIDWKSVEEKIMKVGYFRMDMLPHRPRGCMSMYKEFCGPGSVLLWIFPCRRKQAVSYTSYV